MNNRTSPSLMTIPAPAGLAVTSVTSDNEFLYAWQPDRKTVYKLDACGRILCIFKLTRRYITIHYCGNRRFYATADGERRRIFILNSCFKEIGSVEPDFEERCRDSGSCRRIENQLFVGGAGDCCERDCMLTAATLTDCYAMTPNGRLVSKLSSAGRNLFYTAVFENNGILYEGLECRSSSFSCVRATLLSTGDVRTQRLPFGFRVRSFFCYDGRLYVYLTKNSFHGYVAAVCTFPNNGVIAGDIIDLPENSCECMTCCEESCGMLDHHGSCSCGGTGVTCCSVSTNQTEMCNNPVGGESLKDCDIDELCRLYHCLKLLCRGKRPQGGSCGCSSCGGGHHHGGCSCGGHGHRPPHGCLPETFETAYDGPCCEGGTLTCTCYPHCQCEENGDVESGNCLPLPCPDRYPCPPCPPCPPCDNGKNRHSESYSDCSAGHLKVNYSCGR